MRTAAAGGIQSTVRVVGQMTGPAIVGPCFHGMPDGGAVLALMLGGMMTITGAVVGFAYARRAASAM